MLYKLKNDGCFIIAEAGVNHNGRLDLALQLCDAAKEVGADAVKFQTWKTERLLTKDVSQAEYQTLNTGVKESQFDMLKKLELSYDDFVKIKEHCDAIGITFASTADERESLDFLVELGIPFVKVGSGDIGNIPFLEYIGSKKLPVILSTGMSSLSDVAVSVDALVKGGAEDLTILHCTTSYPCPYDEVNLKAMITLRDAFHYPVGYSDHTIGCEVPVAAVALGASIIEKHFTLDKHMEGPDHLASTEPEEFKEMIKKIRTTEKAIGDGKKQAVPAELKNRGVVTKRIVALKHISKGEKFTEENVDVKRSLDGENVKNWNVVLGREAKRDFDPDEGIVL